MIVDSTLISCLSWRSLPLSIESSNSLSEIYPPRISCHASSFSESVPSVSQSRFAIKRGKSLYFRLGRSRHSRNSPVHRSREYASSQHIANEKSAGQPWSKCLLIDPYSFGQSLHGVFTPLSVEGHHVDRNWKRPSCTRPRGQHSWKSSLLSPEGMVWLCSWCCLIDVECRFSPPENPHLLRVGELESLCQVGCSKDTFSLPFASSSFRKHRPE